MAAIFQPETPIQLLAQFSLNNVHKRGLKHHHFISFPNTVASWLTTRSFSGTWRTGCGAAVTADTLNIGCRSYGDSFPPVCLPAISAENQQ